MKKSNFLSENANNKTLRNILFWLLVIVYYSLVNREYYGSWNEFTVTYTFKIGIMILLSFLCINLFIPKLLNKGKKLAFGLSIIGIILIATCLYIWMRMGYLEPNYPSTYDSYVNSLKNNTFLIRWLDPGFILSKGVFLLTPTIILVAAKNYREQKALARINEQKKTLELDALKNQLNPHFLFNTLNNLYALALKKSDKTPEVIEKLSDILDYMLYRCQDKYVPMQKEVAMIQNYLALEQIRYSGRVNVTFKNNIKENVRIAPLLLLTFIENAFKHGVSQELKEAHIAIDLSLNSNHIIFKISNTIPEGQTKSGENKKQCIGLVNVKKQLSLLYPDEHQMEINEGSLSYSVLLKLAEK